MMTGRGAREAALALAVASLVLVLGALDRGPALRRLETASLDLRFRLRGVQAPDRRLAVVLVDDSSLKALGRWPFSRHLFAEAVRDLDTDDARLIVFDMLFSEAEQTAPAGLRTAATQAASALQDPKYSQLRTDLDHFAHDDADQDFAAALRTSGKVLLPVAFNFTGAANTESDALAASAFQRFDKTTSSAVFPLTPKSATEPISTLASAAMGLGHVNIAYDRDGAPRYDYLALPFSGDFTPSMAVRSVAALRGLDWSTVGLGLGQHVAIGSELVPTDPGMRLLINYLGPRGTVPTYSFADLISHRIPPSALRNHLVVIGASFLGDSDSNASPFGSTQLPGSEREAMAIDTLLRQRFIRESPPPWPLITILAILVLAAVAGMGAAWLPTYLAVMFGLVPVMAWAAGVQLAFDLGLWLPFVTPVLALTAASLSTLLFRYWVIDREGRFVKSAFRRYLSPDMVNALAADPSRLRLGGETRCMTLLFCDVRGFTSISESFKANPEGLTRLINRFLTPMSDIIMMRRGTIDKYMGDCIMAFWNAPIDDAAHADHACESALAMMAALDALNVDLEADARREGTRFHPLKIGIGLNSGDCVVGNMGSERRFDYSVLGDAVNLASRLEGQSKAYGVDIVLGEATWALAPGWATLEIDLIAVKGKTEAVRIFTLVGDRAHARSPLFQDLSKHFCAMRQFYLAQEWAAARAALDTCRRVAPDLAALYDVYDARIVGFETSPPGGGWDGTFVATSK